MDHYPQPRPVLYGTSAEEAPPQTQTQPVREGPPRWPPAPPFAEFGDNPDEPSRRPVASEADYASFLGAGRGRFVVAALYAAASLYALVITIFVPEAFSAMSLASHVFLLFQIAAVVWVVPGIVNINYRGHGAVAVVALIQLVLAIIAGAWFSPGMIVAVAVLLYLLDVPSSSSFK
jgi:hypothetical protein